MAAIDREGIAMLEALGLGAPRLSASALPPYRFIPGLTPRPVADPQGHSFGRTAQPVIVPPPELWRSCEPYLLGCDLYNRAFWWEAHEAWEGLWQNCRERPRQHRFLQGLIQAANAQLKLALGRRQAVLRLWAKAEEHFDAAGPSCSFMGLATGPWRGATMQYLASCLQASPVRHDTKRFPSIGLRDLSE